MNLTTISTIGLESNEISMKLYEFGKKGLIELECIRRPLICIPDFSHNCKALDCSVINDLHLIIQDFSLKLKEYQVEECSAYAVGTFWNDRNQLFVLDRLRRSSKINIKLLDSNTKHFFYLRSLFSLPVVGTHTIKKDFIFTEFTDDCMFFSLFHDDRFLSMRQIPIGRIQFESLLSKTELASTDQTFELKELIDLTLGEYARLSLKDYRLHQVVGVGCVTNDYLRLGFHAFRHHNSSESDTFNKRIALNSSAPVCISRNDFIGYVHVLKTAGTQQLSYSLGISQQEAAFITPLAMVYQELLTLTGASQLYLPGISLCDALLADLCINKGLLSLTRDFTKDSISSAREIAFSYESDVAHLHCVEQLGLQLFDTLKAEYGLKKRDRLLLQLAILLHQCGTKINSMQPLKTSATLIATMKLPGITTMELRLIADIVQFECHHALQDGSAGPLYQEEDWIRLCKLSNIFLLADALDASHKQKIETLKLTKKTSLLVLTATTAQRLNLEQTKLNLQADYFESVFQLRPVLKLKKEHTAWETLN